MNTSPNNDLWLLSEEGQPTDLFRSLELPFLPGIELEIGGEKIDWSIGLAPDSRQTVLLREGCSESSHSILLPGGRVVRIHQKFFASLIQEEVLAIRFAITPVNFSEKIMVTTLLDTLLASRFWGEAGSSFNPVWVENELDTTTILLENTQNGAFRAISSRFTIYQDGEEIEFESEPIQEIGVAGCRAEVFCEAMQETVVFKFVSQVFHEKKGGGASLFLDARKTVAKAWRKGFSKMQVEQAAIWAKFWAGLKVNFDDDGGLVREIRYCIFQFCQGWMTAFGQPQKREVLTPADAFALTWLWENADPVFLRKCLIDKQLASPRVAENVALAFAVAEYFRRTKDKKFMVKHGLELLISANRHWSKLGKSAPHAISRPLLKSCLACISEAVNSVKKSDPESYKALLVRMRFEEKRETKLWREQLEKN